MYLELQQLWRWWSTHGEYVLSHIIVLLNRRNKSWNHHVQFFEQLKGQMLSSIFSQHDNTTHHLEMRSNGSYRVLTTATNHKHHHKNYKLGQTWTKASCLFLSHCLRSCHLVLLFGSAIYLFSFSIQSIKSWSSISCL